MYAPKLKVNEREARRQLSPQSFHHLVDVSDVQFVPHCLNLILSGGLNRTQRTWSEMGQDWENVRVKLSSAVKYSHFSPAAVPRISGAQFAGAAGVI